MLKRIALFAASLSLVACTTAPSSAGDYAPPSAAVAAATVADATIKPPADISPTSNSVIDEKAVTVVANGADLARIAVDGLIVVGKLKPGTPAALDMANKLEALKQALLATLKFQRASQAGSWRIALDESYAALASVTAATKAIKGSGQ